MRINKQIILSCCLVVGISITTIAQSDQQSANSVVKIITTFSRTADGKTQKIISTATGWCWNDNMHVVTALHAVAGVTDISVYAEKNKRSVNAVVEAVVLQADLALLRLGSSLNITPLSLEPVSPNSGKEYSIWGFPHAVFAMQGDPIRFSRSSTSEPTLNSILTGTSNDVKEQLKKQGYPLPDAKILRIGSTIQPGHSGAPIFTPEGKVVGIADGGLYGGTASINWAMPAAVYVPMLLSSNDRKPSSPAFQANLMSVTVVDPGATEAQQKARMETEGKANTLVSGHGSISKTRTASYDQIVASMPADERKEFLDKMKIMKDYFDKRNKFFDIYEDFKTGTSIAMPYGDVFSVSPNKNFYHSYNKERDIFYSVCTLDTTDFTAGKNFAIGVLNNQKNFPSSEWKELTKNEDEKDIDDDEQTADYLIYRHSQKANKTLIFIAAVNHGNVLITYLKIADQTLEGDQESQEKVGDYLAAILMTHVSNSHKTSETPAPKQVLNPVPANNPPSNQRLTKIDTKNYQQLLSVMTNSDYNRYTKLVSDRNINMSDASFTTYRDNPTGITFMMPSSEKFVLGKNSWIYTDNSDNSVSFNVRPYKPGSFEDAQKSAVGSFEQNFPAALWPVDPKKPEDNPLFFNNDKQTATYVFARNSKDGRHVYFVARVSGPLLLVTYTIYNIARYYEPDYLKKYMQLEMASRMVFFPAH